MSDPFHILRQLLGTLEEFPELTKLCASNRFKFHHILLAQSLRDIDGILTMNPDLVSECLGFLDIVRLYSTVTYGDEEVLIEKIKRSAGLNRNCPNPNLLIASKAIDDYLFPSMEELLGFFENNPCILGIYIYMMMYMLRSQSE